MRRLNYDRWRSMEVFGASGVTGVVAHVTLLVVPYCIGLRSRTRQRHVQQHPAGGSQGCSGEACGSQAGTDCEHGFSRRNHLVLERCSVFSWEMCDVLSE